MAESLIDAIKDIGEQSGQGVLTGATELQESLKNMAASFDESSKGTFNASQELQKALEAMTGQAVANIKQTKKLLRDDKINAKTANAAIKRQMKVVAELTEEIERESKTRELGRKDFEDMNKAVKEVNESLKDEIDLIEARLREEKTAALERKVIARAEKREREKARREAAKEREEEARGLAESLEGRIGGVGAAAGLIGAAKGRLGARLGGKKGIAAAAGLGIGAAVIHRAGQVQTRALDTLAGRAANYAFAAGNLNNELKVTEDVLKDVRTAAIEFGMDADQMTQTIGQIASATGATMTSLKQPMKDIMMLAHAGVAGVDELTQELIFQLNTMGKTTRQARMELKEIAGIGRTTSIQMDDFFKAVTTTAGAVDALASNHRDLAKVMAVTIKSSDQLGLSYDRRTKAAQGLTQALTSSFDIGFATVNVQRELALAQQSNNKTLARDAARIQQNLEDGLITQVRAAEMLKQVGGTTDVGIMSARMEQAVRALRPGGGGLEMVNAILGSQVTADQLEVLKEISRTMGDQLSFQEAADKVSGARGRSILAGFTEQVRARRATGATVAQATLEQLETSIAQALVGTLEVIAGFLKDINTTVSIIARFFGKSPKEIEAARKKEEKAAAERQRKENVRIGTDLLVDQLGKLGLDQGTFETDKEFVQRLAKDEGLQKRFRGKFRGGVSGVRELALRDALEGTGMNEKQIQQFLTAIDPKRFAAAGAGGAPVPTSVKLQGGTTGPDGVARGKATVTYEQPGAARQAEKATNAQKATARASARQAGG